MNRIAIVGTGISGLGVASLLHPKYEITVYEKSSDIGGHTRTLNVNYGGKTIAVDTGFIVFNQQNYPNLTKLFHYLNVPVQKSEMTFGITINNGAIEWGAKNLNAVFGQRRNLIRPKFWRFIFDILHFNHRAMKFAESHPQFTLQQLLKKMNMGDWFAKYYILPMGGAIWSCPLDTMLQFPALYFVRFFKAHGLLSVKNQPQWYTVTGGAKEYIKRLTSPFEKQILINCAAIAVKREKDKVQVTDGSGNIKEYDHVVLACHADEALGLLKDATLEERAIFGAFKYQKNRAVLHKDTNIMPKRKRCWSSWVYHSDKASRDDISVTYWMNLLQSIDHDYPLFVTLNPDHAIASEHIFDEHIFEHPIYSQEAVAAQARISSIQGNQNTWFCGAYQRNGFHEDGLASAITVAKALGAEVPWH